MRGLYYRPPCSDSGDFLPWLHELRNQSGAYVIRNRGSGEILYVGESHSGSLAKTVKRHFWAWRDDPERKHNTYQRGRVEIAVRVCPPGAAVGAQDNLIRRLQPRDNGFVPVKDGNPF
jgi:excinuclease UvrABC nuclease subunit